MQDYDEVGASTEQVCETLQILWHRPVLLVQTEGTQSIETHAPTRAYYSSLSYVIFRRAWLEQPQR